MGRTRRQVEHMSAEPHQTLRGHGDVDDVVVIMISIAFEAERMAMLLYMEDDSSLSFVTRALTSSTSSLLWVLSKNDDMMVDGTAGGRSSN